jgi:chemotaxis protein MotB
VPIRADLVQAYPTNWELSAARATRVVRYLDEECAVRRRQLTAAGYSDSRPVASNQTEEGRAANRRIEVTIAPRILR